MRLVLTIYDTRKLSVKFERSKEATPGCMFRVDDKKLGTRKITIYSQDEEDYGFPIDGLQETSEPGLDISQAIDFVKAQFARIGREDFPFYIESNIINFFAGDPDCSDKCTGAHLTQEQYKAATAEKESRDQIIDRYARTIHDDIKNNPDVPSIKSTMLKCVLTILAANSATGVDASDHFTNNSLGGVRPDQKLLDNGINGYEQGLRGKLSHGWDSSDSLVPIQLPEVCDFEGAKEISPDVRKGYVHVRGSCLWMGDGGVMSYREMSLGVHVYPSMAELPQTSYDFLSDSTGDYMRYQTGNYDCDEVGKRRNESYIKSSYAISNFLAVIFALVTWHEMYKSTVSKTAMGSKMCDLFLIAILVHSVSAGVIPGSDLMPHRVSFGHDEVTQENDFFPYRVSLEVDYDDHDNSSEYGSGSNESSSSNETDSIEMYTLPHPYSVKDVNATTFSGFHTYTTEMTTTTMRLPGRAPADPWNETVDSMIEYTGHGGIGVKKYLSYVLNGRKVAMVELQLDDRLCMGRLMER